MSGRLTCNKERRGRDLNPRTPFDVAGFQDRCNRPLCHPSGDLPHHTGRPSLWGEVSSVGRTRDRANGGEGSVFSL